MTDPATSVYPADADYSRLDPNSLVFLGEEHLSAFLVHELPPPGTEVSSVSVDVEPDLLDAAAHEAAQTGRTLSQVLSDRLRRSAA